MLTFAKCETAHCPPWRQLARQQLTFQFTVYQTNANKTHSLKIICHTGSCPGYLKFKTLLNFPSFKSQNVRTELVIRGTQLSQSCSVCERKGIHFLSRKGKQERGRGVGERKQLELQQKNSTRKCLGNIELEGWGWGGGLSLH